MIRSFFVVYLSFRTSIEPRKNSKLTNFGAQAWRHRGMVNGTDTPINLKLKSVAFHREIRFSFEISSIHYPHFRLAPISCVFANGLHVIWAAIDFLIYCILYRFWFGAMQTQKEQSVSCVHMLLLPPQQIYDRINPREKKKIRKLYLHTAYPLVFRAPTSTINCAARMGGKSRQMYEYELFSFSCGFIARETSIYFAYNFAWRKTNWVLANPGVRTAHSTVTYFQLFSSFSGIKIWLCLVPAHPHIVLFRIRTCDVHTFSELPNIGAC